MPLSAQQGDWPMWSRCKVWTFTALALFAHSALGATVWDPHRPGELRVGSIVLGDELYTDVVVSVAELVSHSTQGPLRTHDTFNPDSGLLTVAELVIGGQVYHDVVVRLGGVLSVGGGGPLPALTPSDPLFAQQWHLKSTGQAGNSGPTAKAGEDLNVGKAWQLATGTGIRIAVVDDGLDVTHPDLRTVPGKSWDYRRHSYGDPSSATSSHGTSCAGLAAAMGNNGVGVTGVAFNAQLVGYNLLEVSTDSFGADAMTRDLASNHVYTNSYGAVDGTGLLNPEDGAWSEAIDTGTQQGRSGKGAIYTWAAGNGAPLDRSDYDGQASHSGVLAVGALNNQGQRASYSEPGANLLVVTYGGEYCDSQTLVTTDVSGSGGFNSGLTPDDLNGAPDYTRCMSGTSAAAPLAAGVVALMLEVNPALGWRDVRKILATTARRNHPQHADWITNAAGLPVNHDYGYGAIDALAAVRAAQHWTPLPGLLTASASARLSQPVSVPDNGTAIHSTLLMQGSGVSQLEFVDLHVTSDHPDAGQLELVLTSPQGTASTVSAVRECLTEWQEVVSCGSGLASGFRFGIARLMGESADGRWTLSVRDGKAGQTGRISAWHIRVHGH